MINTHQLLIRPYPKPFESWRGYILRVSEENFANSPKEILRLSTISEGDMRTSIPELDHVASITGKSHDDLVGIYPSESCRGKIRYLGHEISKSYLRINTPAVCTECIKETGYIHANWDFQFMNTCHIHRKGLITHCPKCCTKLSWYRRGLSVCKCGYDFSDDTGVDASSEEVAFAECLSKSIERKVVGSDSTSQIPIAFFNMSPNTLLSLFNTLGTRSILIQGENVTLSNVGDNRVFTEGIKILNNWEQEFRRLMLCSIQEGEENLRSIRKRFKNFHNALFSYKFPNHEIQFLEDAYKRVSLELTKMPRLDGRIKSRLSIKDDEINYVGVYKAAEMLGVMPSTMRRWTKLGKVRAEVISNSVSGNRYLIDTSSLAKKKKSDLGELDQREAGAYLGLPVMIIKSLRSSGHIKSEYRTIYPKTWAVADLDDFISRVYNFSINNSLSDCDDPMDLVYVFQKIKLKSTDMKADILREILDGRLRLFAGSKKAADMYLSKKELYSFLINLKLSKSKQVSLSDLKKLTGLDNSCVESIIASKLFRVEKVGKTYYFNKDDVTKFHTKFVALSRLSAEYKIGIRKLINDINLKDISKVNFTRKTGLPQIFIIRSELTNLLPSSLQD